MFKSATLLLASSALVAATLSGNQIITPHDYPSAAGLVNNPPFCGYPYDLLDLNRVTAAEKITPEDCGSCLQVCSCDSGKCGFYLAIDMGGRGLDVSIGSYGDLMPDRISPSCATWSTVAQSNCDGIYKGSVPLPVGTQVKDLSYFNGATASGSGSYTGGVQPGPVVPAPPAPVDNSNVVSAPVLESLEGEPTKVDNPIKINEPIKVNEPTKIVESHQSANATQTNCTVTATATSDPVAGNSTLIVPGGKCSIPSYGCAKDGAFAQCDHSGWVVRPCAPGTSCKVIPGSIVCDYSAAPARRFRARRV